MTQESFLKWVGKGENKMQVVNVEAVSKYLVNLFKFITIYGKKTEKIYKYNEIIWKEDGADFIKTQTEYLLENKCTNHIVNEVIGKIKRLTKVEQEDFEKTDLNKIPLLNGVWDIDKRILEPHSDKNYFTFIIPIEYNKETDFPTFKKFLEDTNYPEDIVVLQEWFGFCLFRDYFIKKLLIGVGEKDTGKTTLLNILINFIGEKNKSGLSLQKIAGGNDFNKLSLKNKHLNAYDDLNSKDLNDSGNIKVVTGGGFMSAEEKFGDNVQFKPFAKQIFMTNKIPPIKDSDDPAYFDRFMPIKYDNTPELKDPFLEEKISKENSGILNWALEGLYRILTNHKFSYKKTHEEVKAIMESSGKPLVAFGLDVLEEVKDYKIPKEEMYEIYSIWVSSNKKDRLSKEQLGRQLSQAVDYILAKVGAGKEGRYWNNVKIKQSWINKYKELDTIDTISNIIGRIELYNNSPTIDIIKKEASKTSNIPPEDLLPKEPEQLTKEDQKILEGFE